MTTPAEICARPCFVRGAAATLLAMERPRIQLNGEPRDLAAPCTLEGLLSQLDLGEQRVAVAINRDIVPRGQYASVELNDGDRVEILEAVGGG